MSFCSLWDGVRVGWEPWDEVVVILSVVVDCGYVGMVLGDCSRMG